MDYTIDKDIRRAFVDGVSREFNRLHNEYPLESRRASETHFCNLKNLHPHLVRFKSHNSCFCCFLRMPEKVMVCGHALCDVCIQIYGRRSSSEKHKFELSECILCGVNYQRLVFQFVPPTAGIRMLTIDGGGVRGIIPLKFLQHLEKLLDYLDCPIRDHFDYVCGTSAGGLLRLVVCSKQLIGLGGLIVIGMFLLHWGVHKSVQRFEEVAEKTFGKVKDGSVIRKAMELLLSYLEDGQYSVTAIQEAFRTTLETEIQMFNPLRNDTKVAVTTTTANDSTPGLFTNYNGGKRPIELGYDVIRAKRPSNDISLSEA